jgi:hypothetical protein
MRDHWLVCVWVVWVVIDPGAPGIGSGVTTGAGGAAPVCSVVVVVVVSGGDEPHPASGKTPARMMPVSSMRAFVRVVIMISLCSISRTSLW